MEVLIGGNCYGPADWLNRQDRDYAVFLSDNGNGNPFGLIETSTLYCTDYKVLDVYTEAASLAIVDAPAVQTGIGWLLYRDGMVNNVPEPGSLGLRVPILQARLGHSPARLERRASNTLRGWRMAS